MMDSPGLDGSTFALAQLGRRTMDRARDIDDPTRERVVATLRERTAPENWISSVLEAVDLKPAEEARAFGDSLPIGLQLARG